MQKQVSRNIQSHAAWADAEGDGVFVQAQSEALFTAVAGLWHSTNGTLMANASLYKTEAQIANGPAGDREENDILQGNAPLCLGMLACCERDPVVGR